jgi:hypothetical protein
MTFHVLAGKREARYYRKGVRKVAHRCCPYNSKTLVNNNIKFM